MAAIATLKIELTVEGAEGQGVILNEERTVRWAPTVIKREEVSLTGSAFTALSPPTGAKLALIIPPSGAASWTDKGVTGDTGTTSIPSSSAILAPIVRSLGATPSIGVTNGGSTVTAVVIWL
jgi:hypothetical protein